VGVVAVARGASRQVTLVLPFFCFVLCANQQRIVPAPTSFEFWGIAKLFIEAGYSSNKRKEIKEE
jgi:hypothetical protein